MKQRHGFIHQQYKPDRFVPSNKNKKRVLHFTVIKNDKGNILSMLHREIKI